MPHTHNFRTLTNTASSSSSHSNSSHTRTPRILAHISDNDIIDTSDIATSDEDVIVLSDNIEPPRKRPRSNNDPSSRLRRELQKARSETRNAEKRLEAVKKNAEETLEEARRLRKNAEEILNDVRRVSRNAVEGVGETRGISVDALLDIVRCEVCEEIAWCPYILPACGHVFCETCLRSWFLTIVNNHRVDHPHWRADAPAPENLGLFIADEARPDPNNIYPLLLQIAGMPGLYRTFPTYDRLWQLIRRGVGFGSAAEATPQFSCPSCRTNVKMRPVKCYRLKDLTTVIGDVTGRVEPDTSPGKGKRKASPAWDEFFGKES